MLKNKAAAVTTFPGRVVKQIDLSANHLTGARGENLTKQLSWRSRVWRVARVRRRRSQRREETKAAPSPQPPPPVTCARRGARLGACCREKERQHRFNAS